MSKDANIEYVTVKAHEVMPLPVTDVYKDDQRNAYMIVMDATAVRDDGKAYHVGIAAHRDDVSIDEQLDAAAMQCMADVYEHIESHSEVDMETFFKKVLPQEYDRIAKATGKDVWRSKKNFPYTLAKGTSS